MILKRSSFSWLLLMLLLLLARQLPHHRQTSQQPFALPSLPASIRSPEDPWARAQWEQMRLRDPATEKIPSGIRQRELAFAKKLPTREADLRQRLRKTGSTGAAKLLQWSHRGPYNIGGRTRALAIDITDERIILAGGVSAGMWRSTDAGETWQRTTEISILPSVTCIVQDKRPGKTHIWYYGTGEIIGSARAPGAPYRGDGIFKSTDGGLTWAPLPSTSTNLPHLFDQSFDYVWNLAIDYANTTEDEIYAAVFGEIKRSVNGGQTWQTVLGTFHSRFSAFFTDIAITSDGVVYATLSQATQNFDATQAIDHGIYRSTDGVNWVNITPPGWPTRYNRVVIGIAPSDENVVYFLANTPGSGKNDHQIWKYTYLSGDGSGTGGQWEDRSNNLPGAHGTDDIANFDSQNSYDLVIAVKPTNPDIVFIGGTNLYRSSDGFASTTRLNWIGGYNNLRRNYSLYPGHHPDQHALAFLPSDPDVMYSAHDGGVSRTERNTAAQVNWRSLNNGYFTTQFYTVTLDLSSFGSNFVVGGMQDNGTWGTFSTNVASNWTEYFGGDGGYCAIIQNGSVLIVSAQKGQIFRQPLEQFVTTPARLDPAGLSESDYLFINPFIMDTNDDRILYLAGGKSIWRNSNIMEIPQGNVKPNLNWEELLNTRLPNAQNSKISALAVSTSPPDILYYGTTTGEVYKLTGAASGQPVPVDITDNQFPANGYVHSIAVDPRDANKVMVAFSNYMVPSIFYTGFGGETWTDVSGNLEEEPDGYGAGPSVRWVAILPQGESSYYFAGTSTGLYSTTELQGQATTWVLEGASTIGNSIVDMVVTRPNDGQIAVATHGQGVFTSNLATPVKALENALPENFTLFQNYPNPFNPETTIRFALPRATETELSVYDLHGRVVRLLYAGTLPAGTHKVAWNGRDESGRPVASGTYIVRLRAAGEMHVIKATLLR